MAVEQLDLSGLERKTYEFSWEKSEYQLRPATVEVARAYRDKMLRCLKESANGKSLTYSGQGDMFAPQIALVQGCLRRKNDKGEWVTVSETELKCWDDPLMQLLIDKAKEISDLTSIMPTRKEAELKNSQGATTESSE